jgi:hypothetical protein
MRQPVSGGKNGRFSRFVSGRKNSVPGTRLCNEMRAPLREFYLDSIFDFFNGIGQKLTLLDESSPSPTLNKSRHNAIS